VVMIAEEIGEDINCVVLPIGDQNLLVPSVCVAEVLPWRRFREASSTPKWMVGVLTWRGDSIPVVRFENLNGLTEEASRDCECVAVMNRCGTPQGPEFYAIATDGLPRMIQVNEQSLLPEQAELGVAESAAVQLGSEVLRIPNLGYIEERLQALRAKASAPA